MIYFVGVLPRQFDRQGTTKLLQKTIRLAHSTFCEESNNMQSLWAARLIFLQDNDMRITKTPVLLDVRPEKNGALDKLATPVSLCHSAWNCQGKFRALTQAAGDINAAAMGPGYVFNYGKTESGSAKLT